MRILMMTLALFLFSLPSFAEVLLECGDFELVQEQTVKVSRGVSFKIIETYIVNLSFPGDRSENFTPSLHEEAFFVSGRSTSYSDVEFPTAAREIVLKDVSASISILPDERVPTLWIKKIPSGEVLYRSSCNKLTGADEF